MTNYNYFSDALGKRIYTKEQYKEEMKKGGFIPYKEAQQLAEARKKELYKSYDKPSEKALDLMKSFKQTGKRDGSIKLSDRQIDAMKKVGVCFNPSFMPQGLKGGVE